MGYAARHLEAQVMVPWLRLLPNSPTQGHHVSELSSDANSEGQQKGDVKQNQLAPSPLDIFTSSCNAPCFLSVNHSPIYKSRSPRMTGEWTPSYYSPRCEQNHQEIRTGWVPNPMVATPPSSRIKSPRKSHRRCIIPPIPSPEIAHQPESQALEALNNPAKMDQPREPDPPARRNQIQTVLEQIRGKENYDP